VQYLHRVIRICALTVLHAPVEGRGSSNQQSSCDCRDAFTPPGQPESVSGGGRKTDRRADSFTHDQFCLRTPSSELGTVADQLDSNVGDIEASGAYPCGGFHEKSSAWGVGPLWVCGPVVASEIAETCGTQQSVAGCMGDDVTIGVSLRAHFVVEEQTCNLHRAARYQSMNVDPYSGATRG
jgi:hypothetical protein